MKLSDLLDYRDRMIQLTREHEHSHACDLYSAHVLSVFDDGNPCGAAHATTIQRDLESMSLAVNQVKSSVSHAIEALDQLKISLHNTYLKRSEELYLQFVQNGQACLSNINFDLREYWPAPFPISPDEELMLKSRLSALNDWHLPGMIIGAGMHHYIEELVGLDPLYLVDIDDRLLRPAIRKFPPVYQQRLRPYAVNESDDYPLRSLPNNQFGLIFAYDFFTYKPLRIIERYLRDMMSKIRPGGLLAMTINDCDRAHSVRRVEQDISCYTPGHMIESIWLNLKYEKNFDFTSEWGWRYIELRRPGAIASLRGGQSLAKIVPKR